MAQPSDLKNAKSILLVLAAGIGDLVMAAAALKAIRFARPEAKITLLVSPKSLPYAKLCPYVDEELAVPSSLCGLASALSTAFKLRARHFDAAINLYGIGTLSGSLKMRALFSLIKPKASAGRNYRGYGSFFDFSVEERDGDGKCQSDYYAELADLLGAKTFQKDKSAIWFAQDSERAAADVLSANGVTENDRLVGINPASARRTRLWNSARFAQVAAALQEKTGCKFVVLGGPSDRGLADELVRAMAHKPINAAGALSYDETAALIKRLSMLITVHSSVLHTANALRVPCVCLIGPGNAEKDGPYAPDPNRMRLVRADEAPCSPCDLDICRRNRCMANTSVRKVLEASLELWDRIYG